MIKNTLTIIDQSNEPLNVTQIINKGKVMLPNESWHRTKINAELRRLRLDKLVNRQIKPKDKKTYFEITESGRKYLNGYLLNL